MDIADCERRLLKRGKRIQTLKKELEDVSTYPEDGRMVKKKYDIDMQLIQNNELLEIEIKKKKKLYEKINLFILIDFFKDSDDTLAA